MFGRRKLRKHVRMWSRTSDRDLLKDIELCGRGHEPGVRELEDHVELVIDDETVILTYGQYALLYVTIAMFYGRI